MDGLFRTLHVVRAFDVAEHSRFRDGQKVARVRAGLEEKIFFQKSIKSTRVYIVHQSLYTQVAGSKVILLKETLPGPMALAPSLGPGGWGNAVF